MVGKPSYAEQETTFADLYKKIEHYQRQARDRADLSDQYRQALQAMGDPLHIVNRDLEILLFNDMAVRWNEELGLETDVVGRNIFEVFPFLSEDVRAEYRQVFETGKTLISNETTTMGDDEILTQTRKIPLLTDDRVMQVVTVIRNITERKRTEEALEEGEKRFQSLMEQSPNMVFINTMGRVVYANPRCEEIMGYSLDEFYAPGFDFRCLIAKQSRSIVEENFKKYMQGIEVEPYECGLLTKGGKRLDVVLSTKLIDFDGKRSVLGIMADITERKRAEEALRNARSDLEERVQHRTAALKKENNIRKAAEKELEKHQRKLRSLASQLSLAEEKERQRIASEVHDNIGQNLAFAKLKLKELQKTEMLPHCMDTVEIVISLIESTIQDTRSLVSEIGSPVLYELGFDPAVEWLVKQVEQGHGINIRFQNDVHPKPLREDVKVFLFQAVRELLANMVKHSRAKYGHVSLNSEGANIRVDVGDDGVGFEVNEINRSELESKKFGFFSIRERLEPLGGRLDIRSKPGEGTLVSIFAPLEK